MGRQSKEIYKELSLKIRTQIVKSDFLSKQAYKEFYIESSEDVPDSVFANRLKSSKEIKKLRQELLKRGLKMKIYSKPFLYIKIIK